MTPLIAWTTGPGATVVSVDAWRIVALILVIGFAGAMIIAPLARR